MFTIEAPIPAYVTVDLTTKGGSKTLLLEAIQGGAKSASEKRFLYKAIEALGEAEIESLEALYQLKGAEEMRDRFNNQEKS